MAAGRGLIVGEGEPRKGEEPRRRFREPEPAHGNPALRVDAVVEREEIAPPQEGRSQADTVLGVAPGRRGERNRGVDRDGLVEVGERDPVRRVGVGGEGVRTGMCWTPIELGFSEDETRLGPVGDRAAQILAHDLPRRPGLRARQRAELRRRSRHPAEGDPVALLAGLDRVDLVGAEGDRHVRMLNLPAPREVREQREEARRALRRILQILPHENVEALVVGDLGLDVDRRGGDRLTCEGLQDVGRGAAPGSEEHGRRAQQRHRERDPGSAPLRHEAPSITPPRSGATRTGQSITAGRACSRNRGPGRHERSGSRGFTSVVLDGSPGLPETAPGGRQKSIAQKHRLLWY